MNLSDTEKQTIIDHIKNGQIGIAHNPLWYEPYDPSDPDDVEG